MTLSSLNQMRLHVAGTFWQRFVGLLGRRHMAPDEALLIAPCNNVHTCFMRFTIDVVFLDRRGVVMKIVPHLRPWRVAMARKAYCCLELSDGGARRFGLRIGQAMPAIQRAHWTLA